MKAMSPLTSSQTSKGIAFSNIIIIIIILMFNINSGKDIGAGQSEFLRLVLSYFLKRHIFQNSAQLEFLYFGHIQLFLIKLATWQRWDKKVHIWDTSHFTQFMARTQTINSFSHRRAEINGLATEGQSLADSGAAGSESNFVKNHSYWSELWLLQNLSSSDRSLYLRGHTVFNFNAHSEIPMKYIMSSILYPSK